MEKAIEIKRRAQRCIQNGDVDGALVEYEKLVAVEDSDPYNFVLLADLHFKKGDLDNAVQRYLSAVGAYEKSTLFKNAIAVCKKMMRLKLAPAKVLERLAALHALDGLGTEAALYYMQYAESLVRENKPNDAAEALRKAFEASPEEVKPLERLSEAYTLAEKPVEAARAMGEAVYAYAKLGQLDHARRCRNRAEQLHSGTMAMLAKERGEVPGMASDKPMSAPASLPDSRPAALSSEPIATDEDEDDDNAAEPAVEEEDSGIETFRGRPTGATSATPLAVDHDLETFPSRSGSGIPPLTQAVDSSDEEDESAEADEVEVADATPATIPSYAPLDAPATAGAGAPVEGLEITASRHPVAAAAARADEPVPVAVPSEPETAPALDARPTVTEIEGLLARAQDHFKSGEREQAGELLVEAALAYERIERLDNAASIFRSLARGAHATPKMLEHWLANCVRRGDAREAAEVACELGDRAVGAGQVEEAREWFQTALEQDPNNAISRRRLQRLGQVSPAGALPTPMAPEPEPEPVAEVESGRVEMAVGRAEAVTFDLGSLLVEFQRGIEAQLSGDAQSHYDLAMTYWEMGLIEQAMDSFRLAAADAAFGSRAAEMIGRCLLDQGRYDEATSEFQIALQSPDLPADAAIGLRYHLGLALEAAGNLKDAVTEYERVFAQQANYSDVALKLRVLRKALEAA